MATQSLAEVIRWLTPEEQEAVLHFIEYLKRRNESAGSQSPFSACRRRVHRPTSRPIAAPGSVTRYPTVEETVAVHAKLIEQSGGSGGVRDHAALESALARPQSRYYSDLIQEAAAFLRVNGYRMEFNDADALSFLLDLYETNRMTSPELDRCLRQHVVPFDPTAWMDLDQFRCCSPQRQMQRCADARVF